MKKVYEPVAVSFRWPAPPRPAGVAGDVEATAVAVVRNRHDFAGLEGLRVVWDLRADGEVAGALGPPPPDSSA